MSKETESTLLLSSTKLLLNSTKLLLSSTKLLLSPTKLLPSGSTVLLSSTTLLPRDLHCYPPCDSEPGRGGHALPRGRGGRCGG